VGQSATLGSSRIVVYLNLELSGKPGLVFGPLGIRENVLVMRFTMRGLPPIVLCAVLSVTARCSLGSDEIRSDDSEKKTNNEQVVTNSIGMKLAWIPEGKFRMGSSKSEQDLIRKQHGERAGDYASQEFEHTVVLTKGFYLGVCEVTVGQFKQFIKATGYKTEAEKNGRGGSGFDEDKMKAYWQKAKYNWQVTGLQQTDDHPVVNVTWDDAKAFCAWLSKKERKTYALPTEAQWEYSCRAGTTTAFCSGDDPETLAQVGNVPDAALKAKLPTLKDVIAANDGYAVTAPVGKFRKNNFGICDMHGNVAEWCEDEYDRDYYKESPEKDPVFVLKGATRVCRGGDWYYGARMCRSAYRSMGLPDGQNFLIGFRVCCPTLVQRTVTPSQKPRGASQEPPPVRATGKTFTNGIGMTFSWIRPGTFKMGSSKEEQEAVRKQEGGKAGDSTGDELQHSVVLSKGFYLGIHEVTLGQFRQFVEATKYRTDSEKDGKGGMGYRPDVLRLRAPQYSWKFTGFKQTDDHPVVNVSWNDAKAFCAWISEKEKKKYQLPTEAQWEYACRAGTTTAYHNGDDPEQVVQVGNVADRTAKAIYSNSLQTCAARDGYIFTAPVGQFRCNAFGLFDMHGNAMEWCEDVYDKDFYKNCPERDPVNLAKGDLPMRVVRGGGWAYHPTVCRSAARTPAPVDATGEMVGFRVACYGPEGE
jgi:formylglycine-generating enzyme required for sulfatase activity